MLAWLLLAVGLVMLVAGIFVGIVSYEVTLALTVVGAIAALAGLFLLFRQRRSAGGG